MLQKYYFFCPYFLRKKLMKKQLTIGNITRTHLSDYSQTDISKIIENYNLHEIIEQDLQELHIQDKIDVYDNYIFLVLHFTKHNTKSKRYFANELKVIMGKNFIISTSKYNTSTLSKLMAEYQEEIEQGEKEGDNELFKVSPYYILYRIIDAMYDKVLLGLRKFSKDIKEMEDTAFSTEAVDSEGLKNLLIKKRNVILLKHLIEPQEEILEELQKATISFFEGDLEVYFEDLEFKVDKIIANTRMMEENTDSVYDIYDTLTNIRTNKIVGILTIFTAIIGIMTLVSGIYGMNIQLPLADNPYAFVILGIGMLGVAGIMLWVFKKMRWM
ncbi:MAG: hypothetical protein CR971_00330 [candidate division SR1 bacterium]|nr:MAG: hypothetical protein CR971_00330 [candidate division SR1 bacterium]